MPLVLGKYGCILQGGIKLAGVCEHHSMSNQAGVFVNTSVSNQIGGIQMPPSFRLIRICHAICIISYLGMFVNIPPVSSNTRKHLQMFHIKPNWWHLQMLPVSNMK